MLTGAALATTNRHPGAAAAQRHLRHPGAAARCCRSSSCPSGYDVSVNDAFRPLSRFFDRVWRPEQLPAALLGAMRVLTDPAETGAVTLALPQDVQAEAHDWPEELFAKRVWHIARPVPEPAALARAVAVIRSARRPLHRRRRRRDLQRGHRGAARASPRPPASRSPTPRRARARSAWDHPQAVGGVGSTGSPVANALAREADVVIGIGTRYSDFTTASRTAFQHPDVRFVNLNVAALDAAKHAGACSSPTRAEGWRRSPRELAGYRSTDAYTRAHRAPRRGGTRRRRGLPPRPRPAARRRPRCSARSTRPSARRDVVVQAAGSMPGDLQMLWRAEDPKQYHVEYAYSCMGYEIAGALGIKMAAPDREVFVDGRRRLLPHDGAGARHRGVRRASSSSS